MGFGSSRRYKLQSSVACGSLLVAALGCDSATLNRAPDPRAAVDSGKVDGAAEDGGEAAGAVDAGHPETARAAVVRVDFVPIATQTLGSPPQTMPHMELTGLLFLPERKGVLLWEKAGRVARYRLEGDALTWLGELTLPDVDAQSDCGLISLALDPDWESNHFIYAAHCLNKAFGAVTRYRFDGSDYENVADSGKRVIEIGDPEAPQAWHNIGSIGFFEDAARSMWVLAGEKTITKNAQDTTRNLGSVLRIIPRRSAEGGYDPHPDNPFGGVGSDPTRQSSPDLYAWGFRSPWRGAVDQRGRLWIGDVGDKTEEIDIVSAPGQNFGWAVSDGPCDPAVVDAAHGCRDFTDPVVWWHRGADHRYQLEDDRVGATTKRVAWVGTPYRASTVDPYQGLLSEATLFSDMCTGFVRALEVDDAGRLVRDVHVGHMPGLSGIAQGDDGYLYVTSFGPLCQSGSLGVGSAVFRVVPRHEGAQPLTAATPEPTTRLVDEPLGALPLKLSQTGIFADADRRQPIERAVIYEPSLALWSNGSEKHRWLLLPAGTPIDNSDRRHWRFPVGTLFFKTFTFGPRADRIETRVLRRTRDGWDFNAYRWTGRDADLVALERPLPVPTRAADGVAVTHEVPSRIQCRSCHESNATPVIGFDELRLAGPLGEATASQLASLWERGLFLHAPPPDPEHIEHPDARTREVLGYLHGNCAHCHNASANAMSQLDLHHARALANIVGVMTQGSGQASGVRVTPGDPQRSVLYRAMAGADDARELQPMPPLGVQRRDEKAINQLSAWITALAPKP